MNFYIRHFARNHKGSVALLFALSLIPILLAIGAAVDYGRALAARERMADAADAAALAIGSWTGLSEPELKAKAQHYFNANFPKSSLGTARALKVSFSGDDIHVEVSGSLPTTFMGLANINSLDVGATSVVTKKQRNLELALVLDTTGSMGQRGKMQAMQSAAKTMVQDLFKGKSDSETLRIGVVPFSGAVNVGADNLDSGWIDTRTYPHMSSVAKEDFDFRNGESALTLYDDLRNREWTGCVRERAEPYELTDDPPGSAAATKWAPYFAPDEQDTYSSSNDYLDDGNAGACKASGGWGWGGWGGGGSPDPEECQRDTSKYSRAVVRSSSKGPDFNCPPRAVTPLVDKQGRVISAVEQLQPEGSTVIPAGLLWGWRLLSPGEPFTEGAPYGGEKWVKAIVLLTDGQNDVGGGGNGHNNSFYNAFGFAACCGNAGHLGSKSGNKTEQTLNNKTSEVCDAIKEKDILLYTIGFQVHDSTTQQLLRNCASKPDMYYNSPSNAQLATVFKEITQGLSELRIAQ